VLTTLLWSLDFMNLNERRLLDPAVVPETLWAPEFGILFIPPSLAKAYVTLIEPDLCTDFGARLKV